MLGLLVYWIQVILHDLVSFDLHRSLVLSVDARVLGDGLVDCCVHGGVLVLVNGCTDIVWLFDELLSASVLISLAGWCHSVGHSVVQCDACA